MYDRELDSIPDGLEDRVEVCMDSSDVSGAWLGWSTAAESAVHVAHVGAGGPALAVRWGRGKLCIWTRRLGGRLVRRRRAGPNDTVDA